MSKPLWVLNKGHSRERAPKLDRESIHFGFTRTAITFEPHDEKGEKQ